MTTTIANPRPINITPGVAPSTDNTAMATPHFTAAQNVRMFNGKPRKMGGREAIVFSGGAVIQGLARSLFSTVINGANLSLVGTHTRLYAVNGSTLTNITPLDTNAVAAANSLTTLYGALANNPITTAIGSTSVVVADASAARFVAGDAYTLSGVPGAVNGIPAGDLNTNHVVRAVGAGTITINVGAAATGNGAGGGNAVIRSCGIINLAKNAHGLGNGDRIDVSGAANTGGILAAAINVESIIRNVAANSFDIVTAGTSTAAVAAGGGAGTEYFPPLAAGAKDETAGQGYGMGLYGAGLYGTALLSSSAITPVRIWFMDRYANTAMMTPGNQSGIYTWQNDTSTAPTLLENAPTDVNYSFVSNNQVVTFGSSGVENRIFTSDTGNPTNWTASINNQVFEDDLWGAGRLLTHVNVNGVNLIFDENKCWTFTYIGGEFVWAIAEKEPIGIIGAMARVVVNGVAYWMGTDNFYMWEGGNVQIIPSNSLPQSTLLNTVFKNLNRSQASKCFAWYNKPFNEIWFHYPTLNSNEPNAVAVVNLNDFSWVPTLIDRTAAEYPFISQEYPRLLDSAATMYNHEKGLNDNGAGMVWSITGNKIAAGKDCDGIVSVIPDSIQTGNINLELQGWQWPQSSQPLMDEEFQIMPTTDRQPCTAMARIWQYTWSGSDMDSDWQMGQWYEEVQDGSRN